MHSYSTYTYQEILSQPEAWRTTLMQIGDIARQTRQFMEGKRFERVVFTGCGSTYYLAQATASLYKHLGGAVASAVPASEVWLYPELTRGSGGRTLLIAISRSGETTETLQACEAFKKDTNHNIITLSCYPNAALNQLGHLNLLVPAGQEESFAQTRAFTTLYLATSMMVAVWLEHAELLAELQRLPALGQSLLDRYLSIAQEVGQDMSLDRFYFLGSGLRYGLACELSMKMKEMALTHCEPFHVLEFRHGPQAMVTQSTQVIALLSPNAQQYHYERAVLADLAGAGARILSVGQTECDIQLAPDLSEAALGALYLPVVHLIACERAVCQGFNPDRPFNLTPVIRFETAGEWGKGA